MAYIHNYIGYEKINGVKMYLTKNKSLSPDKAKAVKSESFSYFIEKNLEPEIVKVEI